MRKLLVGFCALALFSVVGCDSGGAATGEPVATTEDEFAAYDAMLEEAQAEAAAEEADEATGQ